MTDVPSSESHPCEVVLAEFGYGPLFCRIPANHLVDCGSGCMHWVCDEHVQAKKSETFVPTNEKLDPNLIPIVEVDILSQERDRAIEDEIAEQLIDFGWTPPKDSRWYKEPEFVDNSFQMLIDGEVYTFGLIGVENQEDEGDGE